MTRLRMLFSKLTGLFRKKRLEQQLDRDVRAHLQMLTEENQRKGMEPEEARYAAMRQFGNVSRMKEECRERWSIRIIEELLQDLRYGLRQLRRNPGFTVVAILTLALGIGANTAIFSVIDVSLLRPLPYSHPRRLVDISSLRMNGTPGMIAVDFRAWQKRGKVLKSVGAFGLDFDSYSDGANLTGSGNPVRVRVVPISVGFFHMLGVSPVLGRTFTRDEGKAGHSNVALLSASIWRRDFGGKRTVIDKTIYLDGRSYTVVGIMPAGLLYPPGDVWVPLVLDASNSLPGSRSWPILYVIGRLKAGVGLKQVTIDLHMISRGLNSQFPPGRREGRSHMHVRVIPLRQLLVGDVGHLLFVLLAAVGFVLLIACANLANLLLARAAARHKEMTIRAALGAGRWRLVRQMLCESILLSFFGGCLGLVGGLWAERALRRLVPPLLPSAAGLDYRVLAFGIAVSLGAAVLFGLVPAILTSSVDVNGALKEGGQYAGSGRASRRLRGLLVIGETALALILLVSAGLLGRSLLRLTDVPLGFHPDHLLLGRVWLPVTMIDQAQRQASFFHEVLERLHSMPGVEDAAATTHYPVSIFNALASGVRTSGGRSSLSGRPFSLAYISPDYFRTMRIRLLRGRFFKGTDVEGSRKVVILSRSAARAIFAGREAVGHEVSLGGPKGPWWYVIGVVADTRNYELDRHPWPEIFFDYQQQPSLFMTLVIRSKGDPMQLSSNLRQAVAGVDRNEPVSTVESMATVVQKVLAPRRLKFTLLGSFALLALVLGAIGLYGVISYTVAQRTHEIGVRMALGAEKRDVLKMVTGQGLKLALIGVAIGIGGALGLTRFLSSLLYGVKPTDPLTFIAVSLILIFVALLACYIPARRAAKVDPMVALRCE